MAIGFTGLAQQSATEAPAGFETPTLAENPGSQSTSHGIVEPPGDTFALDQQIYERIHDVNSGLGPVFHGRACAECHQNPVSAGASQFTELRVGHKDANGNFVNPRWCNRFSRLDFLLASKLTRRCLFRPWNVNQTVWK